MTPLAFNQAINTKRGPATFIGRMLNGDLLVSRMVKASDISRGECERRKPAVAEMDSSTFNEWRRSAKFCINEIITSDEVIA